MISFQVPDPVLVGVRVQAPGFASVTQLERLVGDGNRIVRALYATDETDYRVPRSQLRVASLTYGSPLEIVNDLPTATIMVTVLLAGLPTLTQQLSVAFRNLSQGYEAAERGRLSKAQRLQIESQIAQAEVSQDASARKAAADADLVEADARLAMANAIIAELELAERMRENSGIAAFALARLSTTLRGPHDSPETNLAAEHLARVIQLEQDRSFGSVSSTAGALIRLSALGFEIRRH